MPFKQQLAALTEILIEDLRELSPYAMATMAEYGKVSGYSDDYLELKKDVFDLLELWLGLFPDADLRAANDMPPLTLNRIISESFFERERDQLLMAVRRLDAEVRRLSSEALAGRMRFLRSEERRGFQRLLVRSGIELVSPASTAAAASSEKVYVSSRYAPALGGQVSQYLRQYGFEPLGAPPSGAERAIQHCVGGIVSLIQEGRGAPASGVLPSRAFTSGLAEVSMAERRFDGNLVIIAGGDMIERLPRQVLARQVFTVKDSRMDDYELALFGALAAKTPWLRR